MRSGYSDDCTEWSLICWRGAVASAIRGRRGQAFLRELLDALDAMPEKRLVANSFATSDGEYCTLGVIGAARGAGLPQFDPEYAEDYDPSDLRHEAAQKLGIAEALADEIMFENDEGDPAYWSPNPETPEQRWVRMRNWVVSKIKEGPSMRSGYGREPDQ